MDRAKLRDSLRREGLYVAEGDPVLELAAICEVALADTLKVIERVTKQQADRVTAASTQAVVDARKEAELLINEAGDWIENRIKAAGEAAAASVITSVRQETERAERAMRVSVRAAWAIGFFGLMLLSGVAGMALATWR